MAPAFVLLCAMSAVYVEYGEVASVAGVVRGLGAAVIALVAAAVLRVGSRVIHTAAAVAMAALSFVLIVAGLPFPVILVLAALGRVPGGPPGPGAAGPPGGPRRRGRRRRDRRPADRPSPSHRQVRWRSG